jgi:hypothetical protein
VTPFCDYVLVDYVLASIGFTTMFVHCCSVGKGGVIAALLIEIPMWWTVVLFAVYFARHTLTQFFIMHVDSEKTRDTLT